MGVVSQIGGITGTILSVITLITLCVKPIRTRFLKSVQKTNDIVAQNASQDKMLQDINATLENLSDNILRFESKTDNNIEELKELCHLNKEANLCVLSNRIIHTYEKYRNSDSIDSFEVDSIIDHHNVYKLFGGNGKIDLKVNELLKKKII